MLHIFFVFKRKTAYEMRISDWSSDVCSSDLQGAMERRNELRWVVGAQRLGRDILDHQELDPVEQLGGRGPFLQPGHLADIVEQVQRLAHQHEIGRASCRERVCQYVYTSVVAVSLKNKNNHI